MKVIQFMATKKQTSKIQEDLEPAQKDPEIDALLTQLTGRDRIVCIKTQNCARCGGEAKVFRDSLSKKEFTISAMCQACQDKVFPPDN